MNRTTAIILTVVASLFCGCPGLFSLFMGALFAIAGVVPGSNIDIGGSSDPVTAIATGLGMCCGGLFFVAIPVAVGFFTLRRSA